jgi:capsular polysaccharide biosynthesis protein
MNAVRRYIPVVLILTLVGAALAGVFSWSRSDEYLGTTRLFFTTSSTDITDLYQATLAGQARVQTYKVLATDPKVLDSAIRGTGVNISRQELLNDLHVDVPPGTIIMDISVSNSDPGAAAELANAVANGLITLVNELERPLGGGPPPVAMTVVQPAIPNSNPQHKLNPLWIGTGAVIGLLVGVLAASVLSGVRRRKHLLDDSSTDDDTVADDDDLRQGAPTVTMSDPQR